MKKIEVLVLTCILLAFALAGCSQEDELVTTEQGEVNFLPETTPFSAVTAAPTTAPTAAESALPQIVDVPLATEPGATATPNVSMLAAMEEPEETPEPTEEATEAPTVEPTEAASPTPASPYLGYNYTMMNDSAFGFVLNYPTTWINLPGKYTACFQEQVAAGDFPARIAVTGKKLPHKPKDEAVVNQFKSYAQQIYNTFDPKTFEFGELDSNATFMGQKGYAITYLAYSGDIEVKGYMCCCAIDYTVYVFHFCSSYDDYEDMTPVLTRIRDSVALVK